MLEKLERPELLRVSGLRTDIAVRGGEVHALGGIDFSVRAGETLGIVGESGSGKTMTALSIMGLLPAGGAVTAGEIVLEGTDLVTASANDVRKLRGTRVGMIFQDPLTSLNPTMTIGAQVGEPLRVHQGVGKREARERTIETLRRVGMPRPESVVDSYPHQLSGGMRQRVMIAMALICQPRLLIADEPTTALDVTTQRQILDLIDGLRDEFDMGVILITHDLGVVAGHTDRVAVMYAGQVVEEADTERLFAEPRHRYTNSLLAALPEHALRTGARLFSIPGSPPALREEPVGCRFADRCRWASEVCRSSSPVAESEAGGEHTFSCFHPRQDGESIAVADPVLREGAAPVSPVEGAAAPATDAAADADADAVLRVEAVSKTYAAGSTGLFGKSRGTVSAVDRVSIRVDRGRTYGLVGESGCGKSTMGRIISALEAPNDGAVVLSGTDVTQAKGAAKVRVHQDVQMMFQDSYAAMDPRMRIDEILSEPLRIQGLGSRAEIAARIERLLEQVGLPADALDRYPHEFSGGQLQRIGLARSLAMSPEVIVADEPVSALDVSVQAQVLNLMKDLQDDSGVSYVFISHDLAVVQYMADRIGVMYLVRIVEEGPAAEVVQRPKHPYTRALIDAIPVPDPSKQHDDARIRLHGEPPSAIDPPSGCRFRTRCPLATAACEVEPVLVEGEHRVACHFPLSDGALVLEDAPAA